jgi:hypothetical protein
MALATMKHRSIALAAAGCAVIGAACYDLDVTAVQPDDGSAYTRDDVLRKPELIELVIGGLFINFWGGATYPQPWIQLSVFGEEISTAANSSRNYNRGVGTIVLWDVVKEPRVAFDNSLTGTSTLTRDPWSNFYEANAAATEMPRLIKENNLKIIDKATGNDNTHRVLTFAKWLQGMSHIYLGMLFDSAAVINEEVDLSTLPVLPFRGHKEVVDSGIKWLEETIVMTNQSSFIYPLNDDQWIYNTAVSNDELRAISHSYIARALAYSARTPAERAAVDWAKVKEHIQLGITAPFGPTGIPNPVITWDYKGMMSSAPVNNAATCTTGGINYCNHDNNPTYSHAGVARVDLRLLGPADTSGAYQQWLLAASGPGFETALPFEVKTPDKRIQPASSTVPLNKPVYFKYTAEPALPTIQLPERGTYHWSNYWSSSRVLNNHTQLPKDGGGRTRRDGTGGGDFLQIQDAMLLPVEMDLLLAEAEYRLGNMGAAAVLINKSRVANGELPPVTASGVPSGTGCVPRRYDGSCGDLWDALVYEKRIETYGTAISFFDLRGWGCLLEGTMLELPPPGRQLELIGKPIYSYGGGGAGSAPHPTNCPLLHRP